MKTSIIIPAYFADESFIEMTQRCLDSLNYGRPDEVIVVDDGSPIQHIGLTGYDDVVHHIQNLGYAAAVNSGIRSGGLRKFKPTGDVFIIANNDIIFTPGWLEAILKPLEQDYDISSIRTSDNGWDTEDKVTEGDKFGSLFAMKRGVYEALGGFDETFRGYFTDLDYRRRALNAGFKIAKNHNHLVEHQAKATYTVVDKEDKEFVEARQLYIDKWGMIE